tara:strand:+ start:1250 stop:1792 length:543 start_codon:yes stop_codon:yes gene_type:complete
MKKSNLIFFIPFALIICLIGIFIFDINVKLKSSDKNFKLNSVLIGQEVPEIVLDQLEGVNNLETKDLYSNGFKLVNFWASWCAPCRAEHPLFMDLSRNGYSIYGVNYKDKISNAKNFLQKLGNPYQKLGLDKNGRMAIYWGLYGVPETFLVDGSGIIIHRHAGPMTKKIFDEDFLPKMSK